MRPKCVAARLKKGPQIRIVVDLSVADAGDAAVLALHRLLSVRRVKDGEPPESERGVAEHHLPALVGSAMAHCLCHAKESALAVVSVLCTH